MKSIGAWVKGRKFDAVTDWSRVKVACLWVGLEFGTIWLRKARFACDTRAGVRVIDALFIFGITASTISTVTPARVFALAHTLYTCVSLSIVASGFALDTSIFGGGGSTIFIAQAFGEVTARSRPISQIAANLGWVVAICVAAAG